MSVESARDLSNELREAGANPDELWPRMESVLHDALEGIRSIREIVGDLKNMSRADSGQRRRVDMNQVVRAALRIAGGEIRHRTKVVVELGAEVDVDAEAGRLTQVLVNLAVNAAQAMPPRPFEETK